jgi:hypothetical protein
LCSLQYASDPLLLHQLAFYSKNRRAQLHSLRPASSTIAAYPTVPALDGMCTTQCAMHDPEYESVRNLIK